MNEDSDTPLSVQLDAILKKIQCIDFAIHAGGVRPGFEPILVSIPKDGSKLQRGGMNVHIPLEFGDGVKWLARIRQQPTPTTQFIMDSEVETMRVLKAAGLQVPNAFMPKSHPDFCQTTPPFFFGPFESSAHRYLAQVEHVIQEIEQGRAFAEDTTSVYVTHLWLKDLIQNAPRLWKKEETFIKHADDKGDQIMIDENGTLVGVIDWEWAYIASKSEAFAAPLALVDINTFYSGSDDLSINERHLMNAYHELGFPALAACVRNGKVYQRLPMVIGQEPDLVQLFALELALTGETGKAKTIEEWVEHMVSGQYCNQVEAMKKLVDKN
ncbi:hypothetical protein EV368DRAFT_45890 [Lentinula lateritia]|uniref:Uncharacterized protein n=1 Tax=Lentinula aff. lateritia TaxID=2804960 RepID=A0ACC1TX88_9AGAR|nr:hypothetical protein F5876DRAFT_43954 [Lentinula aff. lateritia]KAJ3850151.1 hypothetical protein EV368DRAFT_45890 [Lentinula lateritia]